MKLTPLADRVVLKMTEAEETTKGGIILTGSAKEKPSVAEVIAVGPGGTVDGHAVTMSVKPGDKVITDKYAGTKVTLEDVEFIAKYFPNLKTLDASQCDDYEVLAVADATLTDCELTYYVYLGHPGHQLHYQSDYVKLGFPELLVGEPDYDFEQLMQNLVYLPDLKELHLENTVYSLEQVQSLREAYPDVAITATAEVFGQEYELDTTTELDLSHLTSDRVEATAQVLSCLPNLSYVELMDENGESALSLEDVRVLAAAAPNTAFNYTFELFGQTISTAAETVEYVDVSIGNEGVEEIRAALDLLNACTYFKLDNCGIDNETMAQLRDDYPDVKIVWRIQVWQRTWLTDTEVLRAVYHVDDKNCGPFKYLTDVKYIDLGHNETLTDYSFVSYMPNLEICIASGSPVTDLTPFASCKKLEFLELAWCGHLEDLSPLAECESLKYLNICRTAVKDISPLENLPLERLHFFPCPLDQSVRDAYQEAHPDCWAKFTGSSNNPYGVGWRYDEDGTYSDCYAKVREVFNLDYVDQLIANGAT